MSHAHGYVPVRSEKMAAQPTKCAFEEDENGQEVDFCVVFFLKNGTSSKTKTRFISLNQSARKRDLVDRVFSLDEGTFAKPCESNQLTSMQVLLYQAHGYLLKAGAKLAACTRILIINFWN